MLIGYKLQYQDLLPMTYSFLADMGDRGDELLLRDHYHASNHADFAMPSSRATIQDSQYGWVSKQDRAMCQCRYAGPSQHSAALDWCICCWSSADQRSHASPCCRALWSWFISCQRHCWRFANFRKSSHQVVFSGLFHPSSNLFPSSLSLCLLSQPTGVGSLVSSSTFLCHFYLTP